MLDFFVKVVGVRSTVAMGVAWRGCIERWAKERGKR
jgi:hypothetical protein